MQPLGGIEDRVLPGPMATRCRCVMGGNPALHCHGHSPGPSLLSFPLGAVNAKGLPIGTRVLGFVTHELRSRQLMKVLSLAARVF